MSCNSNTQPLTANSSTSCGNTCQNAYVYIRCREIIIPQGQEKIAVQEDKNSDIITFIFPSENESGISLEGKTFTITMLNSNKQKYQYIVPSTNVTVSGNSIKVKWEIDKYATAVKGTLQVQIDVSGTDFSWSTFPANFYVVNSLSSNDTTIPTLPDWAQMDLSELSLISALADTNIVLVSNNGINYKTTMQTLKDYIKNSISGSDLGANYDATKTQVLKNIQGTLTWVNE